MAPQIRYDRKERCSVPLSLVCALLTFLPVLVITGITAWGILVAVLDTLPPKSRFPGEHVLVGGSVTAAVFAAWFSAKVVYREARWKTIFFDGRTCGSCGYDLTGNESGICPECGERL